MFTSGSPSLSSRLLFLLFSPSLLSQGLLVGLVSRLALSSRADPLSGSRFPASAHVDPRPSMSSLGRPLPTASQMGSQAQPCGHRTVLTSVLPGKQGQVLRLPGEAVWGQGQPLVHV